MFHVTVYPISLELLYTSYVWSGLFDLTASGEITLSVSLRPRWDIQEINGAYSSRNNNCIFYMQVTDDSTGARKRICIDLMDNEGIASRAGLFECDIYFKRSFRSEFIDHRMAFPEHRHKIEPFGLFFPVNSQHERFQVRRAIIAELAAFPRNRRPRQTAERIIGRWQETRKKTLDSTTEIWARNSPNEFEVQPEEPDVPRIQFLTRAFDPEYGWNKSNKDYVQGLNQQRVDLIRALRSHFGERFVGGLFNNAIARQFFPDCIANVSTARSDYLSALRKNRIAITTSGLVDSIPAKLAEYIAATRCILSDPLGYELPYEIRDGEHLLIFRSVDQCIESAERLLVDEDLARHMRQSNHLLYRQHVRPASAVMRCIQRAFASGDRVVEVDMDLPDKQTETTSRSSAA